MLPMELFHLQLTRDWKWPNEKKLLEVCIKLNGMRSDIKQNKSVTAGNRMLHSNQVKN